MYFTRIILISVAIICSHAAYYDSFNYCQMPCNYGFGDESHMICERGNCGVNKTNCREFVPVVMTDKLKRIIIDEHNKLRNKVASGQETRGLNGSQPWAANMMALKYNDELGHVAQCWANTCQPSTHSKCNRASSLPYGGQNLASRYSNIKSIYNGLEYAVKRMINEWYEEVTLFDPKDIVPYKFIKGIGHYTLLVWGEIQEIGCGIARFKNDKWYTISLVCNYGSTELAGNLIGGEMYKIGQPCSACPPGTYYNFKYQALCGEDTLDNTDKNFTSNEIDNNRDVSNILSTFPILEK